MIICKNCGVELEPDMNICPLCEQHILGNENAYTRNVKQAKKPSFFETRKMNQPQRKATWELVSVILILVVIITSIINYVVNGEISWSEYPVATSLVLFSYITCFAFLNQRREFQVLIVLISASLLIFLLDLATGEPFWARKLGIPILLILNAVLIGLMKIIQFSKERGVNLIAYFFLAAAVLCVGIETTVDNYLGTHPKLVWSLIVSACVIPIAAVLLFMHYRMKTGRDLKKTFHI